VSDLPYFILLAVRYEGNRPQTKSGKGDLHLAGDENRAARRGHLGEERRGLRESGEDQPPREYWSKKEGTKRVKRDHRGVEKIVPQGGRQKWPPGPTRGPFRVREGELEPGEATREALANQVKGGQPRFKRGKKRGYQPPKGPGDGTNC